MQRARLFSAFWLITRVAAAGPAAPLPEVELIAPDPAHQSVAERLASELSSEGYAVEQSTRAVTPCESPDSYDVAEGSERVWVRVVAETPTATADRTYVCYHSASGRPISAWARATGNDPATLALSTIEALNGLRSSAQVPSDAREPATAAPTTEATRGASSLVASGTFAFSPPGLPPLLGASLSLRSGIDERVSVVYDAFVTIRPAEIERPDRRLDAGAAWVRLGPRLSWSGSLLSVDASLLGGPALFWTEADAEPPLVGSADSTLTGLVSVGLGAELPRGSAFFLRVAALGTALLPRVTLETGTDDVPAWLFLETSLGLGFRFPSRDGG